MQLSREYTGRELEEKIGKMKLDLLNRLIEDKLILQEARKENINVDNSRIKGKIIEIKKRYPSEVDFQNDLIKQGLTQGDLEKKIREQFLMYNVVELKVRRKIIVKPEEVTDFYEKNKKDFTSREVREVEVISVENKDLADSLVYNLRKGDKIEALVGRYPVTVNNLTMTEGEGLKKETENTVFKLGINEVSNPAIIDDKCYIFKVVNISPSQQFNLLEVQDKIYAFLFDKKMQENLAKWIDELKDQSYINKTE
ncbi:MAG: peptidyl-prolyl cis-trans isomerase [Candidatus Omnitrophica bacterium]|nr:peptidyl-prolyl cis-trans isomerase [Candidatus Omnitrophota bacterium]